MSRQTIGIDIGGTTTKTAVVTADGRVLGLRRMPTECGGIGEFLDHLASLIATVRESEQCEIGALGVAVAGFLNSARDRLAYNPNLPWLVGYPLQEELARRFDVPVILEVDSNAAALAEWRFGTGHGSDRFLCLAAGTGLGGGMIAGGEILRFAYECLGDVGHVIVEPEGTPCSCGGKGCAEALVGAPSVVNRFRQAGGSAEELREVIEQARAGNSVAIRTIVETGRWLGLCMATLATIFYPDRIAIAGGLSEADDLLLDSVTRAFHATASPFAYERATVVKAALGWQATLAGMAPRKTP